MFHHFDQISRMFVVRSFFFSFSRFFYSKHFMCACGTFFCDGKKRKRREKGIMKRKEHIWKKAPIFKLNFEQQFRIFFFFLFFILLCEYESIEETEADPKLYEHSMVSLFENNFSFYTLPTRRMMLIKLCVCYAHCFPFYHLWKKMSKAYSKYCTFILPEEFSFAQQ